KSLLYLSDKHSTIKSQPAWAAWIEIDCVRSCRRSIKSHLITVNFYDYLKFLLGTRPSDDMTDEKLETLAS
ncbi:MAG: hypothetical protein PUK54_04165, partial [Firmicutes bacterium]|nr:hypothetical protein [Bacillota bacterium]MDY5855502.1 hypothetical protein [Anaerovoracaceae bacterium]